MNILQKHETIAADLLKGTSESFNNLGYQQYTLFCLRSINAHFKFTEGGILEYMATKLSYIFEGVQVEQAVFLLLEIHVSCWHLIFTLNWFSGMKAKFFTPIHHRWFFQSQLSFGIVFGTNETFTAKID